MITTIDSFTGYYGFLSNFYVEEDGKSAEHRFQAAKAASADDYRYVMAADTPKEAKKRGRSIQMRPRWEFIKDSVMSEILFEKFRDMELRRELLATEIYPLVEGNYWHDTYWGVCTCKTHNGEGQNRLGSLLMLTRSIIVHKAIL